MLSSSSTTAIISDVAIVGCGVLGTSICKQLLSSSPQTSITAITKTNNNHESIMNNIFDNDDDSISKDNFKLSTYEDICKGGNKYSNVIFCAPPSGFDDYPSAIKSVMDDIWESSKSTSNNGAFIFTSSSAVYQKKNKEIINETTSTAELNDNTSERISRLLKSENNVLENSNNNGYVLRLAGLYSRNRGAHNYYLTSNKDILPGREDYLVNLLHYDDAASACISALNYHNSKHEVASTPSEKNIFLISDGNPKTRYEMCKVCRLSNATEYKIECSKCLCIPKFEGGDQEDFGKILDNSKAKNVLGWAPKYNSFDDYFNTIVE